MPEATAPAAASAAADAPRVSTARIVGALVIAAVAFVLARGDPRVQGAAAAFAVVGIATAVFLGRPVARQLYANAALRAVGALAFGALAGAVTVRAAGFLGDDADVFRWAAAAGAGVALIRAHRGLLGDASRFRIAPADAWRPAATLVVPGLPLLPWGAHGLVTSVLEVPNLFLLVGALYALYALRLLLNLAAMGARDSGPGFLGWIRAQWFSVAVVAALLAGYVGFRGDLAEHVPFFPLLEFALGMTVFGFALAHLRHRVRAGLAERPVGSERRAHAPRLDVATETDYEGARRPLAAFVETGRGGPDYVSAVRAYARLDPARAADVLAPVAAYRRPHRLPALPLGWHAGAAIVASAGIALGLFSLLATNLAAADGVPLGIAVIGLGVYRLQDACRRYARPALGFGAGAAGTAIVLVAFLVFVQQNGGIGRVPPMVWYVVGAVVIGFLAVPALAGYRLAKRLRRDDALREALESPADEIANGIATQRRRGALALGWTIAVAFVAPPIVAWIATLDLPLAADIRGFSSFYSALVPLLAYGGFGLAGAAALRWAGLAQARPRVLADAVHRRAERLALHRQVMDRLAAE